MINWLSEEEQYQEHLNIEQISRIQDSELQEIRSRHWHYRKRILQDEYNISDEKFIKLCKEDWEQEKEEIEKYKKPKRNHKQREVVIFGWRSKNNKCRTCLYRLPKRYEIQRNS